MAKSTHPLLSNREFPEYKFEEYPKIVYASEADYPFGTNPDKGVLCKNPEEEAAYLAQHGVEKGFTPGGPFADVAKEAAAEVDAKQRAWLSGILTKLNIAHDPEDSVERLQALVEGQVEPPPAAAAPAPQEEPQPVDAAGNPILPPSAKPEDDEFREVNILNG